MTKAQFLRLGAFRRGYAVYMMGARRDVPGVPNERNPFTEGSKKWSDWGDGQRAAMRDTIDCDDE